MVMLGYAPLIAIVLDRTLTRCKGKFVTIAGGHDHVRVIRLSTLIAIICLLLTGSYVWPIFTGNMGFNSIGVPISKLTIPRVYYDASDWISAHTPSNESFRTLWVPLDYQAQLDVRWLDVSALTFPLGIGQYVTLPITRYVGFVFNTLASNQTSKIGSLLGPLNVKYVVVNLNSSQTGPATASGFLNYGEPFLFGSPYAYASILNGQKDLKLVQNSTTFLVYLNLAFQPRIDVFDKVQYIGSVGSKDEYRSNLDTLQFLSRFPGYNASHQMLVLEGSIPLAQRSLLMQRSTAVVMSIENAGGNTGYDVNASKGLLQLIRTQTAIGTWTPLSGMWTVQGGQLVGTSPDMPTTWSYADIFYQHANLSDFTVKTQFFIHYPVVDSTIQQPGIFLRQSSSGFYLIEAESDAGRISVFRSGLSEALASAPATVQQNTWYNLTATISGPAGRVHVLVYLNTTLLIDTVDTNTPNDVLGGYIGLRSKGYHTSVVSFKNTSISTLDGTLLYNSTVPWPYTIAQAQIEAPRPDDYFFFAYAPGKSPMTFDLGTQTINSTQVADGWFSSSLVHLQQGTYDLAVNYGNRSLSQSDVLQTHIALVSSNFANVEAISKMPSPRWSFQQMSATEYVLTIESQGPAFVQLSEMFSPQWIAFIDGVEKTPYVAGSFLNGYYVETGGIHHLRLEYSGQSTKNLVTIFWAAAWVFMIASPLYVFRQRLRILHRLRIRTTPRLGGPAADPSSSFPPCNSCSA
jgi:hypothetical protein